MSHVSVLSHEYKAASELSQTINQAVIALKKACLGLPGAESIALAQVNAHGRGLAELLGALVALLLPAEVDRLDAVTAARIPGALVARLQAERRGDLAYYLDDLKRLVTRLDEGATMLTQADFDLLDQLAAATDAQAASVFRRLMRV